MMRVYSTDNQHGNLAPLLGEVARSDGGVCRIHPLNHTEESAENFHIIILKQFLKVQRILLFSPTSCDFVKKRLSIHHK